MTLRPFKIFDADKSNLPTKAFGGESSGIRDWDNIKYPTVLDMSKNLFAEYWTEDEVKLGKDLEQYRNVLSDSERYVYNILTGMLNILDSIASDFLDHLKMHITDPSIRSVIALINSFEVLHNRSYQYLTSTMLNSSEKHQAFEEVKHIEVLQNRNEIVFEKIQKFIDVSAEYYMGGKKVDERFMQVLFEALIAYQNLEGLFFTGGFVYFHSLAREQKMIQSNNMIILIKADETQHSEFMGMLTRIVLGENPHLNTRENMNYAVEFIQNCVEAEKKWAGHIFKEVDLFSIKEYENYVEYLANVNARNAGIEEPFPENTELKSRWIVTYGSKKRDDKDSKQIVTRTDFLQGNATNYAHRSEEDFDL